MPPYWDKSPPYTYPNPTRYFFNFLIISFIFIKNKCFSDVIWNLKSEKKKFAKGFEPMSIASKGLYESRFTICTTRADA